MTVDYRIGEVVFSAGRDPAGNPCVIPLIVADVLDEPDQGGDDLVLYVACLTGVLGDLDEDTVPLFRAVPVRGFAPQMGSWAVVHKWPPDVFGRPVPIYNMDPRG